MSTTEQPVFKTGDTCYDIQGNECSYIDPFESRHAIALCHYSEEGDGPFLGEVFIASSVFTNPPVQKRHDECARLDGLIMTAKRTLRDLEDEIRKANRDMAEVLNRIKEVDDLVNIDRFIAGEITHFVIDNDTATVIQTFEKAIVCEDERNTYHRLLSLYGDAKRKPLWGIAKYGDGSGSSLTKCIPCVSIEDAKSKAVEIHANKLVELRKQHSLEDKSHVFTAWADSAQLLGVSIPDDINAVRIENRKKSAANNIKYWEGQAESASENLAKAKKNLDEAMGVSSGS